MKLETYIRKHYSATTVKTYLNQIGRFEKTANINAETAGYKDILYYIGLLRKDGLHPKTLHKHLFAIKIYYRYLVATGKRKDHPCHNLVLKDKINRQVAVECLYSKTKLESLYENYKSINPKNKNRDKVLLSLLIYQGLTALEIRQLKNKDLDLKAGTIKIKDNKKNKGRLLWLKPNQILLFSDYLKEDRSEYEKERAVKTDWFVLSETGQQLWDGAINRMLNKGRLKYERLQPQKIRQSVIANLLKEKNDVRIVQEFAGHRSTGSTEAYSQTGFEELKMEIEKKHPLQ